jgi:hypothetical protein
MRSPKNQILCTFLFLLLVKTGVSQVSLPSGFGGSVGLVAALGNRFDRLGICVRGYYVNGGMQVNADLRFYGNIKNLGPPGFYPEGFVSLGIVYGYGRKDSANNNRFLSSVSNQTGWSNSVGYCQNIYFNQIGTTQRTGTVSLQFNKFDFITENDILARPLLDRFRTGAVLLQYTPNKTMQVALNCAMWTGQMSGEVREKSAHFPNGHMDSVGCRYCGYSHGLLSMQVKTLVPLFDQTSSDQQAQVNVGIDAEQVRNAVQNKMIHDLVFLPKRWRTDRNCDVPMLDEQGNPFLYLPGQKIKKPAPYVNGFLNPLIFY